MLKARIEAIEKSGGSINVIYTLIDEDAGFKQNNTLSFQDPNITYEEIEKEIITKSTVFKDVTATAEKLQDKVGIEIEI